jgi:hypothetical protein
MFAEEIDGHLAAILAPNAARAGAAAEVPQKLGRAGITKPGEKKDVLPQSGPVTSGLLRTGRKEI